MPFISPVTMPDWRQRRTSYESTTSSSSTSSAFSAAASMSEEELDNFRSMRGKSGFTTTDASQHMSDDVDDLADRLQDVRQSRELERRLSDTTGQAFTILITPNDVRLMHVDERGDYHFNHFNTYKTRSGDAALRSRQQQQQSWRIIDDDETNHAFVDVSPTFVTIYHADGTWSCRRHNGQVFEVGRPGSKRVKRPGGETQAEEVRVWRLYSDTDRAASGRSSNASPIEAQLCANTPGEKGQHHVAHKSFYHDL